LIDEFKLTHQEAAEAIGRSRAATANRCGLHQPAEGVQAMVFDGKLEMGHGACPARLEGRPAGRAWPGASPPAGFR